MQPSMLSEFCNLCRLSPTSRATSAATRYGYAGRALTRDVTRYNQKRHTCRVVLEFLCVSKRCFETSMQVIVAIDDSKSMTENSCGAFALEALALICQAMSRVEVSPLARSSSGRFEVETK